MDLCKLSSTSSLSMHRTFCVTALYIYTDSCTYMILCLCICVYIKQPLTAIGGGGGAAGVFALAAVQHSTFLCDIQYCDLRKPALRRSSRSLSRSLTILLLPLQTFFLSSCHLLTSLFPSFPSIFHSTLFSYLYLGNHLSSTFFLRSPYEVPLSVLQV